MHTYLANGLVRAAHHANLISKPLRMNRPLANSLRRCARDLPRSSTNLAPIYKRISSDLSRGEACTDGLAAMPLSHTWLPPVGYTPERDTATHAAVRLLTRTHARVDAAALHIHALPERGEPTHTNIQHAHLQHPSIHQRPHPSTTHLRGHAAGRRPDRIDGPTQPGKNTGASDMDTKLTFLKGEILI